MKILHLTKKYPGALGGDATVVYNLEKQLALDHEVHILTSNCPEITGTNVLKFGLKDTPSNLDRITFRRILSLVFLFFWGFVHLKRLKPDVIHSHSADLGFFISFPARVYKIPIVNTCQGISFPYNQYSFLKRFMEKFFLRYAGFKRIIVVNRNSLILLEKIGLENALYIPNGVEIDRFDKKIKRDDQRVRFLFVGRLEPQKGLEYLIEAVKLLDYTDFEVLIVGEGSQRDKLERLTDNLGLGGVIRFLGRKDGTDLLDMYLSCDVFVLPSLWEGLSLSLLEAMAAGLPVIVTDVGGADICVNNENALVVSPGESGELADAMARLMDGRELRGRMGENSRALIGKRFSWEDVAEKVLEVYRLAQC